MDEVEVIDVDSDSDVEEIEVDTDTESVESEHFIEMFLNPFRESIHNMQAEIGRLHLKNRGLEVERSQLVDDKIDYWTQVMDLRKQNKQKDAIITELRGENANLQARIVQPPNNEPNQEEEVAAIAAPLNENGGEIDTLQSRTRRRLKGKSQKGKNYQPSRATTRRKRQIRGEAVLKRRGLSQKRPTGESGASNQNEARNAEASNVDAVGNPRDISEDLPQHGEEGFNPLFSRYVCMCGKNFATSKALKAHIRILKIWETRWFAAK